MEYITDCPSLYKGGRFSGVFTKLRVLELEEYAKVILLDTDLIIRKSIDELFWRQAPAALRRSPKGWKDHVKIDGSEFFNKEAEQTGGINAGVVLLEPSREVLRQMEFELAIDDLPEHAPSTMPEQDFLSRFYINRWWSLGVQYNYQLHQLAFCDRPGYRNCIRRKMEYDEIFVIHYSALPKPVDKHIAPEYVDMDFSQFMSKLKEAYTKGVNSDRYHLSELEDTAVIVDWIGWVTAKAVMEWTQHFQTLMKEHQNEISRLCDAASAERRNPKGETPGRARLLNRPAQRTSVASG